MSLQSRKSSLIEAILNVCSGMIIAWTVTQFIFLPVLGIHISYIDNMYLTIAMAVVSTIRAYIWRRLFNWWSRKK